MPAVRYTPFLVVDPKTNLPLLEARGAVGNVVAEGTTTPLTLTQDAAGTIPMVQPITLTPAGYVPQFWVQEGLTRATFIPLSGTWTTPLVSPQGLEEAAAASATAAAASATAASIAVSGTVRRINGISPNAQGDVVIATGTGGGTTTVEGLTDATTIGKAVVKAADAAAARTAIGAGTSSLTAGWTNGQAAPAADALRARGTTAAQTIDVPVTFTKAPTVPADSFQPNVVVGLPARLQAVEARLEVVVRQNAADLEANPPAGDAIVLYREAPTA